MSTNKLPSLEQLMSSLPSFRVKSLDALQIREGYVLYEHLTNHKTKGGLYLPETSKPVGSHGVVLKVNKVEGIEVGDILIVHDARQSIRVFVDDQPFRWIMVSREDNHLIWTKPENFLGYE